MDMIAFLKYWWYRLKDSITGPPVIISQHGQTTEWARYQAAINMRLDPKMKQQIVDLIALKENLSSADALKTAKKRYPEAWR